MTLYRGTSTEALGKLKNLSPEELVGEKFIEPGFMSTSTNSSVVSGTFSGNMQITIEASRGAKALEISNDILEIRNLNKSECKLYGGIFGFCIGDMLGVPVEFSTREERVNDPVQELRAYGTYHQSFGTWSDNTSMTLCLMDAINNGFSLYKLAENFMKYYREAAFTLSKEIVR